MQNKLKGTGVAIITPFLSNGNVDFKGLEILLNDSLPKASTTLLCLAPLVKQPP